MADNARALRSIMKKHGLTRRQVATMALASESTVDAWLAPKGKAWHRKMPDRAIALVRLQLEKGKP